MQYKENIQVLIYLLKKYENFYTINESGYGYDDITSIINSNVSTTMEGYILKPEFLNIINKYYDISIEDLGITILMMHFGKHYSCNQYEIYINTFKSISEIKLILDTMSKFSRNFIKLPKDLSVDHKYGLLANQNKFIQNHTIKKYQFLFIIKLMSEKSTDIILFIDIIKNFHISIITSFYNMTSVTDNLQKNIECSNMLRDSMHYEFRKFESALCYFGDYWFIVPQNAIWFSYMDGKVKYSSYAPKDFDNALDRYKILQHHIVGYISNGFIVPLIIEHPMFNGEWEKTINFFISNNIPIHLFKGSPNTSIKSTICFVVNKNNIIYRLKKN